MAPNGTLELFFRRTQTLPTFWAERIWILRILVWGFFWTPHFWISRSPDLQMPRFPGPQISKFPDFQVPRFPDAAGGAAAAGRILRSQPDPSPNAPRDQIRRKGPCCDLSCLRNLSLSRLLNCKPENSMYSRQRMGRYFDMSSTRRYIQKKLFRHSVTYGFSMLSTRKA